MKSFRAFAGFILISLSLGSTTMAADALSIMQGIHEAKRVDDEIATLSFRFKAPDKSEKHAIYTMVWKNMHGKNGYDNKAIYFTESPPERKGIAYMGWLRQKGGDKLDDEWIYLPELRVTRRIVPRDHDHSSAEDEFGMSLLGRDHLEPGPPHLYDHKMIGEQLFKNQPHYLISSTLKHHQNMQHNAHGSDNRSTMRINWVDKNSQRLNFVQFFDNQNILQLEMQIHWTEEQGYWIWQGVEAINPNTQAKTVLEISDIKINTKLKDRIFSKRSLRNGANRFK